jgi:uncharacterized ferritin-like protein (DUF455 family)
MYSAPKSALSRRKRQLPHKVTHSSRSLQARQKTPSKLRTPLQKLSTRIYITDTHNDSGINNTSTHRNRNPENISPNNNIPSRLTNLSPSDHPNPTPLESSYKTTTLPPPIPPLSTSSSFFHRGVKALFDTADLVEKLSIIDQARVQLRKQQIALINWPEDELLYNFFHFGTTDPNEFPSFQTIDNIEPTIEDESLIKEKNHYQATPIEVESFFWGDLVKNPLNTWVMPKRPERPILQHRLTSPKELDVPLNAHILHTLAHIELNAVEMYLDTILRFGIFPPGAKSTVTLPPYESILGESEIIDIEKTCQYYFFTNIFLDSISDQIKNEFKHRNILSVSEIDEEFDKFRINHQHLPDQARLVEFTTNFAFHNPKYTSTHPNHPRDPADTTDTTTPPTPTLPTTLASLVTTHFRQNYPSHLSPHLIESTTKTLYKHIVSHGPNYTNLNGNDVKSDNPNQKSSTPLLPFSNNWNPGQFTPRSSALPPPYINFPPDSNYPIHDDGYNIKHPEFIDDMLSIVADESRHFTLCCDRLEKMSQTTGKDFRYGSQPATFQLWVLGVNTRRDIAERLAVIPLSQEARGLDSTTRFVDKLYSGGDKESALIVTLIGKEEERHVALGVKWLLYTAAARGVVPPSYAAEYDYTKIPFFEMVEAEEWNYRGEKAQKSKNKDNKNNKNKNTQNKHHDNIIQIGEINTPQNHNNIESSAKEEPIKDLIDINTPPNPLLQTALTIAHTNYLNQTLPRPPIHVLTPSNAQTLSKTVNDYCEDRMTIFWQTNVKPHFENGFLPPFNRLARYASGMPESWYLPLSTPDLPISWVTVPPNAPIEAPMRKHFKRLQDRMEFNGGKYENLPPLPQSVANEIVSKFN